ncbi:late embryogenesis abundant protein [Tasmannia lanceolata]|uniref:late embryogenesis abundant protein n=1 Tax=Tasmannia lanceolata TaxID=3420 RepID=UPI0040648E5E
MHAKSDSEVTSIAMSSPHRPLYYVQSPSTHDVEKMSFQSSPIGSPHHYHCSPIHHSRESSTTRFSASLKNPKNWPWKRVQENQDDEDEDEEGYEEKGLSPRFYAFCFVFSFAVLFTLFSLILWGASKPYKPIVFVKSLVFESFNIQAGTDDTGVPTKMLHINSTVKISFRNPATFFGVHVFFTPIEFYFYQLRVASGNVEEFYQARKSQRVVSAMVEGEQIPLYGGGSSLSSSKDNPASVPLTLIFTVRSRAYVLGKLVKTKFHRTVRCSVTLKGNGLGKPVGLKDTCLYD